LASFRHTFSHYHLDITPVIMHTKTASIHANENNESLWYNTQKPVKLGLAAPVKKLLTQLT